MAQKAKQRFSWDRNPTTGIAIKKDGDTGETLEIRLDSFDDDIQDHMSVYGLTKVCDDRCSGFSADNKLEATRDLIAQFLKGDWKAEKVGGIHVLPVIIGAIQIKRGWSVTQAQLAYKKLDEEQRAYLRINLASEMAQVIETRSAEAEVSLEAEAKKA